LDVWFEQDIKPRLEGRAVLIRFADDAVLGFSREENARRVLAVLPKRFSKYGLTLHPEKTRLVDFRKPRRSEPSYTSAPPRRRSFDLLGFTHYWARSRRGFWVIKRKTATDRLSRAITRIGRWCRAHRHAPVGVQHRELTLKLRGTTGTTVLPDRELTDARAVSASGQTPLALLAQSAITEAKMDVGTVYAVSAGAPAAPADRCPLDASSRSESVI
jgi:Reverse transcriptase (RNA-dependent DNA polymerase)